VVTKTARAYEEVVEFIAAGPKLSNIIAFKPSVATKERVAELIYQEKTVGLTPMDVR
jgi:hypothetical protein